LIAGGVVVAQSALLASLTSSGANAQPPGNNGTVKIENVDVDSGDDENNANHPHVACPFAVRWYGYDTGTRTFSMAFEAQPPSGNAAVAILSGPAGGTFEGHGPGDQVDHEEVYELDTTDLYNQPNQGYHIKLTVTTDGSQGNDTKHKVFWMDPCAEEPSPSPSPSESPSVSPSVLPTVIESSPSISPSVQGVKIVKPPAALPHTGPGINMLVALFGIGLILTGSGLVLSGKERGAHQF